MATQILKIETSPYPKVLLNGEYNSLTVYWKGNKSNITQSIAYLYFSGSPQVETSYSIRWNDSTLEPDGSWKTPAVQIRPKSLGYIKLKLRSMDRITQQNILI
ncbi:hypothetical protein MYO4S_00174 [Serratia phage 4S]|nr:hypothetical protein MYO4S_00174 [Serratia phage 4S]